MVKSIALLLVLALVLFPDPRLLARFLNRLQHLDKLIEPDAPQLADLEAIVRAQLPADAQAATALPIVEEAVYQRLPYAWDWDNWFVMEYLPTTREALDKGREDCDGRAIVAAALLRRMGYEAWLVSDVLHMWVETPTAELMAPTGHAKSLAARPGAERTSASVNAGLFVNLGRGLSYGVSVFPLGRELIILLAVVGLTLHPRLSMRRGLAGIGLLLAGFWGLKVTGVKAALSDDVGLAFMAALAAGLILAGWLALSWKGAKDAGGKDSHQPARI